MTTTEHGAEFRGAAAEAEGASIETAFAQLVGRQATQAEGERLNRLRSVLGLRDNDAFWAIVMALEHYDSFFRAYPAELAEVTGCTIEKVRVACASAAARELLCSNRCPRRSPRPASCSRASSPTGP